MSASHSLGAAALLAMLIGFTSQPNLEPLDGMLLSPCPDTPNCVSTAAADSVHSMPPLPFRDAPEQAHQRARAALLAEPRSKIVVERPGYIHADIRSLIFRFVDDVEVAIAPGDSVLHFRSASRVGRGDMGVNRKRMERFSARFTASGR